MMQYPNCAAIFHLRPTKEGAAQAAVGQIVLDAHHGGADGGSSISSFAPGQRCNDAHRAVAGSENAAVGHNSLDAQSPSADGGKSTSSFALGQSAIDAQSSRAWSEKPPSAIRRLMPMRDVPTAVNFQYYHPSVSPHVRLRP
jgi:hypothetical protein